MSMCNGLDSGGHATKACPVPTRIPDATPVHVSPSAPSKNRETLPVNRSSTLLEEEEEETEDDCSHGLVSVLLFNDTDKDTGIPAETCTRRAANPTRSVAQDIDLQFRKHPWGGRGLRSHT